MPDKPKPIVRTSAACALIVLGAAPAPAALPDPVRAMIEAARDSGDATTLDSVVRVARQTNPGSDTEIDALLPPFAQPMLPLAITPVPFEGIPVAMIEVSIPVIWSGEGELGGFLTTGKTESVGGSALFKIARERGTWRHSLSGRADYQETGGVLTREFFQLGYKVDWKASDTSYVYGITLFERDRLAGFYSRLSAGGGMGLKLANSASFRLNVEGGPALRRTFSTDGRNETSLTARGGLGLDWRITERLRAQENASIYTEAGATSIETTTAIDTRLMRRLSARLSHSLRYERAPLANSVGTDTVTRASVVYSF